MDDPTNPQAAPWTASPTAKARNAAQRAVTALLDELAPERVLKRAEDIKVPVEQHRTPTGCVLQAAKSAISVSWFVETGNDPVLGELHVVVWSGVLSRRGALRKAKGATIVSELVLQPFDCLVECKWRAADGTEYETIALAAHCVSLLESQRRADPS
ncbi:MAG: hypothetical protein WD801_11170 [Gemmatimonadaceae bacterium]